MHFNFAPWKQSTHDQIHGHHSPLARNGVGHLGECRAKLGFAKLAAKPIGCKHSSAMPPKGNHVLRSTRYQGVVENIRNKRQEARDLLQSLKKQKKAEDRRHRRLMRSATRLDARDLMELAGIKNITMGQLGEFCDETGVERGDWQPGNGTSSNSCAPPPPEASTAPAAATTASEPQAPAAPKFGPDVNGKVDRQSD